MKKILLAFCLMLSITQVFSQKIDLGYLKPESTVATDDTDPLYIAFVQATGIFAAHPNLQVIGRRFDLVALTDKSVKVIVIPITGVNTANLLLAFVNTATNEYSYVFMEFSSARQQATSTVFDETGQEIYRTLQTQSQFDITVSRAASCFSGCMDSQEENFEDTFAGYVYWNIGPQAAVVQGLAAVNCQGCCRGWWHNGGC